MDTQQFLQQLYPEIEDHGFFGIWTTDEKTEPDKEKPTKRTGWFSNYQKASEYIKSRITTYDIYCTTGIFKHALGVYRKGYEHEVSAIPGLWADIDIAHKIAHKKENLPPDQKSALSIVSDALPPHLSPTIIVNSGHGLQVWWLFKELYEIENKDETRWVKRLVTRFHRTLKMQAAKNMWDVDSLLLGSVLRVPGTLNNKDRQNPKPVEVIEYSNRRYNPEDFDEYLIDMSGEPIKLKGDSGNEIDYSSNPFDLVFNHDATPPEPQFSDLMEMDLKFANAFTNVEAGEKGKSLNEPEMTLANLAKSYGWTDQAVCDLIIAFRRKHAESDKQWKKGLRVDYVTRTIDKAKIGAPQTKNLRELEEASNEIRQENIRPETKDESKIKSRKEHLRDQLSGALGIKINTIIKYLGDNPTYEISVNDSQRIDLGTVDQLINQNNLRKKIAAHCNVYITRYKSNEWDTIATNMMQLVEEIDPGTETRAAEIVKSWVIDFWYSRGATEDIEVAVTQRKSYYDGENSYMFGNELRNAMSMNNVNMSPQQMAPLLRSMGCQQTQLNFRPEGGKNINRKVYNVTPILEGQHESAHTETNGETR